MGLHGIDSYSVRKAPRHRGASLYLKNYERLFTTIATKATMIMAPITAVPIWTSFYASVGALFFDLGVVAVDLVLVV